MNNLSGAMSNSDLFVCRKTRKGRVLKTRTVVPQGTLLIEEEPFFTIAIPDPATKAKSLETTQRFENKIAQEVERTLSERQRVVFQSLHNNFPKYPFSGIQKTNSLICESKRRVGVLCSARYGVYPIISHASHACSPNAHYSYDLDTGLGRVHAIREIPKDEKITISRTTWDIFSRTLRRNLIQDQLGHECNCDLCGERCGNRRDERERRREEMQWYLNHRKHPKLSKEDRHHALLMRISVEYGYSEGTPWHAQEYEALYRVYINQGMWDDAMSKIYFARANYLIERAYRSWIICEGRKSRNARRVKKLWEDPAFGGPVVGDTPEAKQAFVRAGITLEKFEQFLQETPKDSHVLDSKLTPLPDDPYHGSKIDFHEPNLVAIK